MLYLFVALLPGGCRRDELSLSEAHAEPATAVQQLAEHLRANDLVGYARSMVGADQYVRLELAWREGRSRWPLTELPLSGELPGLLAALSQPDAENTLLKAFDSQLAGQHAGIRQTAHSLGLFGLQYLRSQTDYAEDEREHYMQLVTALSNWAGSAPLADRERAQAAILALTKAVRASGLDGDAALQAAGMEESLRRLGPVLAAFKSVLASYDLPLDSTLATLKTGLLEQKADNARVHIQYSLAQQLIKVNAGLVRRQGHWYLQRTQTEVEALLEPPPQSSAAVATKDGASSESQPGR